MFEEEIHYSLPARRIPIPGRADKRSLKQIAAGDN
jgi:hypothetical protein